MNWSVDVADTSYVGVEDKEREEDIKSRLNGMLNNF